MSDTTATPTTAPAAPVDPWAFLGDAIESTDLTTVKKATTLSEIPLPVVSMCERALVENNVLKIRFPDEKMARDCVKLIKAYVGVREATATVRAVKNGKLTGETVDHTGPVTARVVVQADKKVLHLTVKIPYTPTPKPLTAEQVAEKAAADEAASPETDAVQTTPDADGNTNMGPAEKIEQGDHSIAENAAAAVDAKAAAKPAAKGRK
jgi:hypothetical protein